MDNVFYKLILNQLVQDKEYFAQVFPYLKSEYFETRDSSIVFDVISEYAADYHSSPGKDTILVEVESKKLNETEYKDVKSLVSEIFKKPEQIDPEWMYRKTEDFCRERAMFNAIAEAVAIIDGVDKNRDAGAIPTIVSEALAVCFDTKVGHDYFEDMDARFESYHRKVDKLPFDIDLLNTVTNGGIERKTLNLILAPSNAGKSAAMCSMAASHLALGYNVLYITLELAEEKVGQRIDANLLSIPIDQLSEVPEKFYKTKLGALKQKSSGRLQIKEYPTGAASVNHFKALLNELRIKKNFIPDVVYVDYLGICASAHFKAGSNANTYTIQKSISEELRAFAVENNLAVVSAIQTNRSGYNNSDINETTISESIGVLMTADFVLGLIRLAELDELGQVLMKQIKSRYGDPAYMNKFVVGFDRKRMKLYNLETQGDINHGTAIPQEKTPIEEEMEMMETQIAKETKNTKTEKFQGFQF